MSDAKTKDTKLLSFHVYECRFPRRPADPRWCVASVHDSIGVGFSQCARKPKHEYGGHGWCAQHYPPNVHARSVALEKKWQEEWAAREAARDKEKAEDEQKSAALDAIRKIAAGHNDPRGLAIEVLEMGQGATT